jgi:beta-glucanase (GH16 family)
MEVPTARPRSLTQALHMPRNWGQFGVVWGHHFDTSLAAGFHVYGFEWEPGLLQYLVDGRQTASLTQADVPRHSWVFQHPFFLIMNLLVGTWGGVPDHTTHWPAVMKVDWVRVWK